jgi:hypothetical protein
VNAALFGTDHASAVLLAGLLWRSVWGLVVYATIATAFEPGLAAKWIDFPNHNYSSSNADELLKDGKRVGMSMFNAQFLR